MALPDGVRLTESGELLQRELANQFEHGIARLAACHLLVKEALVDKRSDAIENRRVIGYWVLGVRLRLTARHPLCGFQREAIGEDGQIAKEGLVLGGKQVIAPSDRIAHGAQA